MSDSGIQSRFRSNSKSRYRESSVDSLFSERSGEIIVSEETPSHDEIVETSAASEVPVASRKPPPVPGLWVFPSLLPDHVSRDIITALGDADIFSGGARDQVMLFEAPKHLSANSNLPAYIHELIDRIRVLLLPQLPAEIMALLFDQSLARQVILNLYPPGEGITPHVDLPNRYADGIIGCSLIGGCVMTLQEVNGDHRPDECGRYDVYLPPRTVYVLSGEARWDWTHGIKGREFDIVQGEDGAGERTLLRDLRVSATFRWMKDGADILS
ncbi:hypothetical protein I317_04494 [Kwoniella heveanensis CBS 569]|nr:hypothetical protein I317_04494 [Kwoniella heveanensis CBS 569]